MYPKRASPRQLDMESFGFLRNVINVVGNFKHQALGPPPIVVRYLAGDTQGLISTSSSVLLGPATKLLYGLQSNLCLELLRRLREMGLQNANCSRIDVTCGLSQTPRFCHIVNWCTAITFERNEICVIAHRAVV